MSQQKLVNELKQSIEELNSGFDKNHQTLTGQIKKLNDITDELEKTTVGSLMRSGNRIAAVLDLGLTKPMIQHLRVIYNTIKELQQMKEDSDHNKEMLRSVRSAKLEKVGKTLELHKQLNGTKDTLLQDLDHYKITGQNETKAESETLIRRMRETAKQFQKIVNEIKSAKEYVDKLV
ncbi:hypothetical protein R3I93_001226 [Phoxinus phoxinus]